MKGQEDGWIQEQLLKPKGIVSMGVLVVSDISIVGMLIMVCFGISPLVPAKYQKPEKGMSIGCWRQG
ncbi:MAG: hypothetical protein LBD11_07430 [Candidatus Peribacteria bacterium]|nr:hypothetical protein [Candidatus Peribacteria bacterium]